MATPDAALTAILTGTNGLTTGTNLFNGPLRPRLTSGSPAVGVFVLASGGPQREGYLDGNANSPEIANHSVQITVRGDSEDFEGGQTLARGVFTTVHNATVSGYFHVRVREAAPLYLGINNQGLHLWTMNIVMRIEE